jgi:hypothetical protein
LSSKRDGHDECLSPSAHLKEALALAEQGFDLGQERLEPLQQGAPTRVANPQPQDDRSGASLPEAMGKVFVLGDKDGLILEGTSPDRGIVGISQANIDDVFGQMATGGEQPRKCRRQLGIDEEAHGLSRDQDRMIRFGGGVFQARPDVFRLEIGIVI